MPSPNLVCEMKLRGAFYCSPDVPSCYYGAICKDGLRRLFHLPPGNTHIVCKAYDRKVKNTKMIRFKSDSDDILRWSVKAIGPIRAEVAVGLRLILEKHFPSLCDGDEITLWVAISDGHRKPHFKPR